MVLEPNAMFGTVAAVNNATPANPDASDEATRLRRENEQLSAEICVLELKVKKLQRQLWDKKSERVAKDDKQGVFFEESERAETATAVAPAPRKSTGAPRRPKGPQPLNPALPREVIHVPAPDLKELISPVTRQPMKPGFVERIEVLARRVPVYYVKAYERTVFVSSAKNAPVYSAWPADVLPRSRVSCWASRTETSGGKTAAADSSKRSSPVDISATSPLASVSTPNLNVPTLQLC